MDKYRTGFHFHTRFYRHHYRLQELCSECVIMKKTSSVNYERNLIRSWNKRQSESHVVRKPWSFVYLKKKELQVAWLVSKASITDHWRSGFEYQPEFRVGRNRFLPIFNLFMSLFLWFILLNIISSWICLCVFLLITFRTQISWKLVSDWIMYKISKFVTIVH